MALTAKKVYAILKRQISDMEAKLNSPVRYRGTVATADLLPLNPDIGDMYNIESKSVYGEAGMNVAWNGVAWDTMGAPIDMSLYIKSSELADWVKQQNKPTYTAEEVGALPADTKIPSKTSDLQNDSGFLTKIPDNYLSGTDKTLNVSGKAADAKATGDKITELSADISNKLNKNQGSENSGKIAGINESGDIVPMFPVSVDYNEETNCLEFGSDQKMELNKGINLDSTLTKTGYAADAGAVGEITNSLKEDLTSKADKTALVKTDRKLDALWKLNQGISYEFQTDEAEAYQKTVPSGAKVANVKSIGGKTIVWNQIFDKSFYKSNFSSNGITFTVNEDGGFTLNGTATTGFNITNEEISLKKQHKYLMKYGNTPQNADLWIRTNFPNTEVFKDDNGKGVIFEPSNDSTWYMYFALAASVTFENAKYHINIFDLTQMFGAGNEPSTPEEFEAMFPGDYYPYNAGEPMSAPVNEVVEQGRNLLNLDEMVTVGAYYGIPIYKNATATLKLKDGKTRTKASIGFIYNIKSGAQARWLLDDGENIKQLATFESNISNDIKIFGCYPGNVDTINMLLDAYEINLVEGLYDANTMPAYSPYHKTSYPIPQAILNLPGYGWSAGDVRNEVDWENKQYIQRVTKYTFQGSEQITNQQAFDTYRWVSVGLPNSKDLDRKITGDFVSDGLPIYGGYIGSAELQDASGAFRKYTDLYFSVPIGTNISEYLKGKTIYYELAEPIITDISDLIGNTFQEPLEVEAGGTLTFKNSNGDDYRIPVQSTEEYLVSLAEVAK